jgi:hypothetical protein
MALAGWANVYDVSIPAANIDATLTDFPILIQVSAAAGTGAADLSGVFTELNSGAGDNDLRVAFADSGDTELYAEAAYYDHANSILNYFVKVPTVSAVATTVIQFHYDSNQAPNTSYVGRPGSAVAQNVWDANFFTVLHLTEQPDGTTDEVKDSTSNANHMTATKGAGTYPTRSLSGPMGVCMDFDGGDFLRVPAGGTPFQCDAAFTTELICQIDTANLTIIDNGGASNLLVEGHSVDTDASGHIRVNNAKNLAVYRYRCLSTPTYVDATYRHFAHKWDGTTNGSGAKQFMDGTSNNAGTQTATGTQTTTPHLLRVGGFYYDGTDYATYNGKLAEIRLSTTDRSNAWLDATYDTNSDNLVSYSAGTPVPGGGNGNTVFGFGGTFIGTGDE